MKLEHLPLEHRHFTEQAMPVLQQDSRILGVAAAGSWIDRRMDRYSDLDFVIVSHDSEAAAVASEKMQIANSLGKLLTAFTGEHVGEPRLLIGLYDEPLIHVDLKFVSLTEFGSRVENPIVIWERDFALSKRMSETSFQHPMPDFQWIEDRFWVWVHYAALRLGRGEYLEVIDFLGFLRGQVLGPLTLVKQGQLPRGVRRIEIFAPDSLDDFKATLALHDRASCKKAIEAAADFYRKLRSELAPAHLMLRPEAENRSLEFLARV